MKQETVQSLHDTLLAYHNQQRSQSLSMCTEAGIAAGEIGTTFSGALYETHTKGRFPHPNKKD